MKRWVVAIAMIAFLLQGWVLLPDARAADDDVILEWAGGSTVNGDVTVGSGVGVRISTRDGRPLRSYALANCDFPYGTPAPTLLNSGNTFALTGPRTIQVRAGSVPTGPCVTVTWLSPADSTATAIPSQTAAAQHTADANATATQAALVVPDLTIQVTSGPETGSYTNQDLYLTDGSAMSVMAAGDHEINEWNNDDCSGVATQDWSTGSFNGSAWDNVFSYRTRNVFNPSLQGPCYAIQWSAIPGTHTPTINATATAEAAMTATASVLAPTQTQTALDATATSNAHVTATVEAQQTFDADATSIATATIGAGLTVSVSGSGVVSVGESVIVAEDGDVLYSTSGAPQIEFHQGSDCRYGLISTESAPTTYDFRSLGYFSVRAVDGGITGPCTNVFVMLSESATATIDAIGTSTAAPLATETAAAQQTIDAAATGTSVQATTNALETQIAQGTQDAVATATSIQQTVEAQHTIDAQATTDAHATATSAQATTEALETAAAQGTTDAIGTLDALGTIDAGATATAAAQETVDAGATQTAQVTPTDVPVETGSVAVTLVTDDDSAIPDDTIVCLDLECQSLASLASTSAMVAVAPSGTVVTFTDITSGDHLVSITVEGVLVASATVTVAADTITEVTIVVPAAEGTPPNIIINPPGSGGGDPDEDDNGSDDGGSSRGDAGSGSGSAGAPVTSLPSTGAGNETPASAVIVLLGGVLLIASAGALAIRNRHATA